MKITVVGAGSIGGLLGARLHAAGEDVTLIARGPHLAAIEEKGLTVTMKDGEVVTSAGVKATADMRSVGEQDLVVLGVKAHQLAPVVDDIRSMFGSNTMVLTTQNGIPWWYFNKLAGDYEGTVLRTLDPDGKLSEGIDAARIIGCIAYPAAEISEPGHIRHIEGTRFPVGELDGSRSDRLTQVSEMLGNAGFKSPILDDIRSEIWLKAWGNLTFNPVSALTHATLEDMCRFPASRALARTMMEEAQTVAEHLGASFRVDIERRIAGAESVGKHKTSMLQDVEAGKKMEVEAIIGAVSELGRVTGIPTPAIDAIYAATSLLSHTIDTEKVCIKASPWDA